MKFLRNRFIVVFIFVLLQACGEKKDEKPDLSQRTCPLQTQDTFSHNNIKLNLAQEAISSKFLSVKLNKLKTPKNTSLSKNKNNEAKELDYSQHGIFPFDSPDSVDLGMGDVPVFDQGPFGTCVTFAATAAMNVILKKRNFISQQCSLMLDSALNFNFWDGAYEAGEIIEPLKEHGLVSISVCPFEYPDKNSIMTLEQYHELADTDITANNINHKFYKEITLDDVKAAIQKGHRILFGFGVQSSSDIVSIGGFNVKVNCVDKVGGLWACQQPGSLINYCEKMTAGHEAIIIGFDEKQQLLRIRNSWGPDVGHNGDFYMTYEFFQRMKIDGTEIY